jgi:hypothetical protein
MTGFGAMNLTGGCMQNVVAALLLLAFTAVGASAAPLDVTSIVGPFEDGSPAANVTALANQDNQGTGQTDQIVTSQPISEIPEPATLLMFGAGLGAIAFRLKSRRRRS